MNNPTLTQPPNTTPGPWVSRRSAVPDGIEQYLIYPEDNGYDVALSYRSKGDAALIAAAPELYSALKRAEADLEGILPEYEPSVGS